MYLRLLYSRGLGIDLFDEISTYSIKLIWLYSFKLKTILSNFKYLINCYFQN